MWGRSRHPGQLFAVVHPATIIPACPMIRMMHTLHLSPVLAPGCTCGWPRSGSFALLLGFTMLGLAFLYRFAPYVTTRRPGPLRRTNGDRPRHGPQPQSGRPRS